VSLMSMPLPPLFLYLYLTSKTSETPEINQAAMHAQAALNTIPMKSGLLQECPLPSGQSQGRRLIQEPK